MGVDSGAQVIVWPPELFPEVAAVESQESRRGVKYVGLGDNTTPTLSNLVTTVSKLVVSLVFSDGQRTRRALDA